MNALPLKVSPVAGPWTSHRVVTFNGQHDTRIKTGEDYLTLSRTCRSTSLEEYNRTRCAASSQMPWTTA